MLKGEILKKRKKISLGITEFIIFLSAIGILFIFFLVNTIGVRFESMSLIERSFFQMAIGKEHNVFILHDVGISYLCWLGVIPPISIILLLIVHNDYNKYFALILISVLGIVFIFSSLYFANQMYYKNWETSLTSFLSSGSYYAITLYFGVICSSIAKIT